jgi:uncharacterized protein (TIGR03000 family)
MFHQVLFRNGTLLVAGALTLLTAGPGLTQPRPYSGPSPTYAGGSLSSSYSNGGYYGTSRPVQPQYHPTYSNYGWTHYYNYYPHYGEYRYGVPYYSYNNGYAPPTSGYRGSYLEPASEAPDREAPASPSKGYVPTGGLPLQYPPPTDTTRSGAAAPSGSFADFTVKVPANATVWFNGTKMVSTGSLREYRTPSLTPQRKYTYEVRARWEENGREVTQTQKVTFAGGSNVVVNFPTPAKNSGQARGPD